MTALHFASLDGGTVTVRRTDLDAMAAGLRGICLAPGHPGYEAARRIHNGMIDRHPALIVRCAGAADVSRVVRFASDHGLRTSIRSGGHGVPGFAVCDDGLMIDLSAMKGIRVEPPRGTARAEAGVTWGEFDLETQAFGLATTGGAARPTGIAGLTLAGGHGFLMRKHGLTCDNLLSADVVTADGVLRTASRMDDDELFWALRGGGGNFGVVTSFEYQLHRVGPMLGGLLIFPFHQARAVLRGYHEFTASAPDTLGSLAILATLPDGSKAAVLLLAYNGPPDEGAQTIAPLRKLGTPLADTVAPTHYTALQGIVEAFNPPGLRNYWKTSYLHDLPGPAADELIDHYARVPSPHSHVVLYTLGGAVARVPADSTAVSYRDSRHILIAVGMWSDPAQDAPNLEWVRGLWTASERFARGGFYVNYDADIAPDRVAAAYGPAKFSRLTALKARYDPQNLFRLNQNIPPIPEPA